MKRIAFPEIIEVCPWEATGVHDLRSPYAERFWLPVVGPTATVLLRRLGLELDQHPEGFPADLAVLSSDLGIGYLRGLNSPLVRNLNRLVMFHIVSWEDPVLYVRRRLTNVMDHHLARMSDQTRESHRLYEEKSA